MSLCEGGVLRRIAAWHVSMRAGPLGVVLGPLLGWSCVHAHPQQQREVQRAGGSMQLLQGGAQLREVLHARVLDVQHRAKR